MDIINKDKNIFIKILQIHIVINMKEVNLYKIILKIKIYNICKTTRYWVLYNINNNIKNYNKFAIIILIIIQYLFVILLQWMEMI